MDKGLLPDNAPLEGSFSLSLPLPVSGKYTAPWQLNQTITTKRKHIHTIDKTKAKPAHGLRKATN